MDGVLFFISSPDFLFRNRILPSKLLLFILQCFSLNDTLRRR